ncbi:MAG TPA: class I SAM-dependent methyltransferase [Phycisphaerales bacterium]|nr:class I SAM-dependent methyltransferase [Phycisphaerales bacterium]
MRVTVGPRPPLAGKFFALNRDIPASSHYLCSLMMRDPRLKGRVLDVGCGEEPCGVPWFHPAYKMARQLDGVDPFPGVLNHPWLTEKWCGEFDTAPIPENAYDAMISINVVEHVKNPPTFLAAICRALKPGGVYYSVTPHRLHPFSYAVLLVEALKLKEMAADRAEGEHNINRYPAYYRLNCRRDVMRAAEGLEFEAAEFHYHPVTQWKQYFPKLLRFIPQAYDFAIGVRFLRASQQFMFKLEKRGTWEGLKDAPASASTAAP